MRFTLVSHNTKQLNRMGVSMNGKYDAIDCTQGHVAPFFAKCSLESFQYMRGEVVENKPVNLSLCKSIKKGKFAWYPDNEGKPSILFNGCGVEWAYHSKQDRDDDFERIAGNAKTNG
jgi:hypothetical protein